MGLSRTQTVLPTFPNGALPDPEPPGRKRLIRGLALFTLALSVGYLTWRVLFTVNLDVWYAAVPLLLAEMHNAAGFLLFTLALWDRDVRPPHRVVDSTPLRVAVLIPTYNEPLEVLLPTVAGAVALQPAHQTWVLDDGRRDWVREMAEQLGARYLTRPDNRHAKAGNLNHALQAIDADIVAVLDADHVPLPNFLRHTLGYFDDPRVAIVQTPQDFYNLDSFEHEARPGQPPFYEEAVFYRVIGPAKNRWGAAFWCGTSALVRVAALRDVGGVATETVTEDIHTTMRLNRRGWKAVYHNEVVARGLAPTDASQYLVQRNRWALGAMQVLRRENPLFAPGFTWGQRLAYATTLFAWFDSWRTFTFLVLAPVVLFTGASPIDAPGYVYGPLFLGTFLLQFVSLRLLARGYYPPLLSLLFEVLRMPAVLPATLALFRPSSGRFAVTPKGRTGDRREQIPAPTLLKALLALNVLALAWCALTLLGLSPLTYRDPAPAIAASVFALLNTGLLLAAIRRVEAMRYGTERRSAPRFEVLLPGRYNGVPCRVVSLSVSGAAVHLPAERALRGEEPCVLSIDLPGASVTLRGRAHPKAWLGPGAAGVEFAPGQYAELALVARALLWGTAAPVPAAAPAAAA